MITTDTHAPTTQDRLEAAAGERRSIQAELDEMRRRRDAWKDRANRLAAGADALQLAVQEITEDRDRTARLAAQRQEEITRVSTEASSTLAALEAANARILELTSQLAAATSIAESADLGWKGAQVDLDAETHRVNRLEASIAELALAVGQPTLRGQELLDHMRETEQLVHELRQVVAEQKVALSNEQAQHAATHAAHVKATDWVAALLPELETARAERAGLLQVIDQLLRARRALERESEMVATRTVVVAGVSIPWDDSPAPEILPGCWDEQAEIGAAQVLARLEADHG